MSKQTRYLLCVLALIQIATVLFGVASGAVAAKPWLDRGDSLPSLVAFWREWGFALLVLPVSWLAAALWAGRDAATRWQLAAIAVLGITLLAVLVVAVCQVFGIAVRNTDVMHMVATKGMIEPAKWTLSQARA
jgi:hypothetical protein